MNGHKNTFYIYGRPQITNISNLVKPADTITSHIIMGHGFWSNDKKMTLVTSTFSGVETDELVAPLFGRMEHERLRAFLIPTSGSNTINLPMCAYNLFKGSVGPNDSEPTLTTKYPAFTGIEITPTIINENLLEVTIPPALSGTLIDIIISNRAGYGRASLEVNQASDQTARLDTTLQISSSGMIVID